MGRERACILSPMSFGGPVPTWSAGMLVGGAYQVEAPIGKGGMGTVFRAVRVADGTEVALKLLTRTAMLRDDGVARFKREAELAKQLTHESTIRVLDGGDAGDGTPFIAFELLDGVSLDKLLTRGPLPDGQAANIAVALLGSLGEAHARSIVHRDVKPGNVFLCARPAGLVKLLDFGVAKSILSGGLALTGEGIMVGTPAYMAPEQIAAKDVTPASDLYAVALVLAEMLTGKPVYDAAPLAICMDKVRGIPVPFTDALRASPFFGVLDRATRSLPSLRFESALAMQRAIEAVASGRTRPLSEPEIEVAKRGGVVVSAGGTEVMEVPREARPVAERGELPVDALAVTAMSFTPPGGVPAVAAAPVVRTKPKPVLGPAPPAPVFGPPPAPPPAPPPPLVEADPDAEGRITPIPATLAYEQPAPAATEDRAGRRRRLVVAIAAAVLAIIAALVALWKVVERPGRERRRPRRDGQP